MNPSPPSHSSPSLQIICGDALTKLREMPDASVHCCVTSPPYWGLRDYGHASQLGQEPTPEQYVANLVAVFREVKRVLRADATCWLNLGDSYCNTDKWGGGKTNTGKHTVADNGEVPSFTVRKKRDPIPGLKPKDLIGIPWRVAFALQAEGWYLRSDIIWAKRNCMPESVTDRPTRSHEYLFLLTKSQRYYYDYEAIKEPCVYDTGKPGTSTADRKARAEGNKLLPTDTVNGIRATKPKTDKQRGHSRKHAGFNDRWDHEEQTSGTRNKRDVWTVAPANYAGAHFATYPPALIEPCILAGTSAYGCCAQCGAPYQRLVTKGEPDLEHQKKCGGDKNGAYHGAAIKDYAKGGAQDASATKARILAGMRSRKTTGWQPTCRCEDSSSSLSSFPSVQPCVVLDPFAGSGTTGEVALEHGRSAILIELNPANVDLCHQRCHTTTGLALA